MRGRATERFEKFERCEARREKSRICQKRSSAESAVETATIKIEGRSEGSGHIERRKTGTGKPVWPSFR